MANKQQKKPLFIKLKRLMSQTSVFMTKVNEQTGKQDVRHDYEHLARLANLRYISDDEPGYERRRWGRGLPIVTRLAKQ